MSVHTIVLLIIVLMLLWLRRWPLLFAVAVWPGTLAHELLHFLAGWITGARPVSFSVIPRRNPEGGWVLGSVAFLNLRWWNSVPVGLAPLALLPGSVALTAYTLSFPLMSVTGVSLKIIASQCLIASWPSPRDWSHAMLGLVFIGILALAVYLLVIKTGVLSQ